MVKIANEQIAEIRNSLNIVDLIGEYLPLVQKGRNYFCVCPFHDDHNPSMSVSKEKQIYTCFVCGATGNVFTFLMEYEHLSFMDAVYKVADKTGIKIEKTSKPVSTNNKMSKMMEMYQLSSKIYQNNLLTKQGKEAKEYLIRRGIRDDIIKEFEIGVSFKDNKIYQVLKEKYSDAEILSSGLCNKSERGFYDMFSERIMFPLPNLYGNTVAFSGRIYRSEDSSKYVNSRESEIFKKGDMLFNYHRAKEEIRRERKVIIVEGFMDVIALYKVGIKNVIATMGTAITKEQANLIKRLSKEIILMFDGDKAGEKATIHCGEELTKIEVIPRVVRLADGLDPDEYIAKYGIEKLKMNMEEAIPLFDFKTNLYKKDFNLNSAEDISQYINKIVKELELIDDLIVREVTIKKLSAETGVSIETIQSLFHPKLIQEKPKLLLKPNIPKDKYEKAEEYLLYYMLKHKEIIRIVMDSGVFFSNQTRRFLASEIINYYNQYNTINEADFLSYLMDKKELNDELKKIMVLPLQEECTHEEINDYLQVIHEGLVEKEINRLKKVLKEETDSVKQNEIACQIIDLIRGEKENGK